MTTENKTTAAVMRVEVKDGEPSLQWSVDYDKDGNQTDENCVLWTGFGSNKVVTKQQGYGFIRQLVERGFLLDEARATEMAKSIESSGLNEAVYLEECSDHGNHGRIVLFRKDGTMDSIEVPSTLWGTHEGMSRAIELAVGQGMPAPTDVVLVELKKETMRFFGTKTTEETVGSSEDALDLEPVPYWEVDAEFEKVRVKEEDDPIDLPDQPPPTAEEIYAAYRETFGEDDEATDWLDPASTVKKVGGKRRSRRTVD